MKSSRKSHRKSRMGCSNCKTRKVKCDEQKPACQNCIKHCVQCIFPITRPATAANTPDDRSGHNNSSLNNSRSVGERTPNTGEDISPGQIGRYSVSLNLVDLELLHNFSTSTCYTLNSDPTLQTFWRITVPQLGISFPFVMNATLALSAHHLACCRPQRKDFYTSEAMLQHRTGLRDVAVMLAHITEENCHALYIFTVLTSFLALVALRKTEPFFVIEESGFADLLFIMRGTSSIVESSADHLRSGVVAPIFEAGLRRNQLRERMTAQSSEESPLRGLRELIDGRITDRATLHAYTTAIDGLEKSLAFIAAPGLQSYEPSDVFNWFFRLTDDYISLLRERVQEALTIFAYFCVLPKRLESNWWLEGWSSHVMSQIYNSLDQEHRLWIRWPIEQIGWVMS